MKRSPDHHFTHQELGNQPIGLRAQYVQLPKTAPPSGDKEKPQPQNQSPHSAWQGPGWRRQAVNSLSPTGPGLTEPVLHISCFFIWCLAGRWNPARADIGKGWAGSRASRPSSGILSWNGWEGITEKATVFGDTQSWDWGSALPLSYGKSSVFSAPGPSLLSNGVIITAISQCL